MFTMSIDKGIKKGDDTILVALVGVKPDVKMEVPDCVAELLKQYADVMLPELPKNLPPRKISIIKLSCFLVRLLLHRLLIVWLLRNWLNCANN